MYKISKEQLAALAYHNASANKILTDVLLNGATQEKPDTDCDRIEAICSPEDFPPYDAAPVNPALDLFGTSEYDMREKLRKRTALEPLCGRWMAGKNRCGIEITRGGDHYILTYLKKNGRPTDQRFILMWLDGDIIYYGFNDRMTSVALNKENDVLMISPGLDYSRVPEIEK